MDITVREKVYSSEHLTDINYLPIGSLFVGQDGHFYLEGVEDYESLPQSTKSKLVQPLMKRLSDPDEKAAIAHSLSAIFPSLPRELVRYNGKHDFAMNLTLQELLTVAIALGNALNPVKITDIRESAHGDTPRWALSQEIAPVEEAAFVRIWNNIERIQTGIEFSKLGKPDMVILNGFEREIQSISAEVEDYRLKWDVSKTANKLPSVQTIARIMDSIRECKSAILPNAAELARAANIARVEEELAQLKSSKGFGR